MAIVNRPLPLITQDINFEFRNLGDQPRISQDTDFSYLRESRCFEGNAVTHGFVRAQELPGILAPGPYKSAVGEHTPDGSPAPSDEEGQVQLIRRPPGQAGRPNSGGYNLEDAVGWPREEFVKLQKFVLKACAAKLDMGLSYQHQEPRAIDAVCLAATTKFTALAHYEDCWPVRDLLKSRLKRTFEKERNQGVLNQFLDLMQNVEHITGHEGSRTGNTAEEGAATEGVARNLRKRTKRM